MNPPWDLLELTMCRLRNQDQRVNALGRLVPADLARAIQTYLPVRQDWIDLEFKIEFPAPTLPPSPPRIIQHKHVMAYDIRRHGFGGLFTLAEFKELYPQWVEAQRRYPELVEFSESDGMSRVQWWL